MGKKSGKMIQVFGEKFNTLKLGTYWHSFPFVQFTGYIYWPWSGLEKHLPDWQNNCLCQIEMYRKFCQQVLFPKFSKVPTGITTPSTPKRKLFLDRKRTFPGQLWKVPVLYCKPIWLGHPSFVNGRFAGKCIACSARKMQIGICGMPIRRVPS